MLHISYTNVCICDVCIYVYHKIYIRIVPCRVSATIICKTSSSKKKERKKETKQQICSPKNTLKGRQRMRGWMASWT